MRTAASRGLFENPPDAGEGGPGAGRVVRIRDQNRPRGGADRSEQFFQRERQILGAIGDLADVAPAEFGIEAVHRVGRLRIRLRRRHPRRC